MIWQPGLSGYDMVSFTNIKLSLTKVGFQSIVETNRQIEAYSILSQLILIVI